MQLIDFTTKTNRKNILGYSIRSDEVIYLERPTIDTDFELFFDIINQIQKQNPNIELNIDSLDIIYKELDYILLKFS